MSDIENKDLKSSGFCSNAEAPMNEHAGHEPWYLHRIDEVGRAKAGRELCERADSLLRKLQEVEMALEEIATQPLNESWRMRDIALCALEARRKE